MSNVFFKVFPTPVSMSVPAVGFDLTDEAVRFVAFERDSKLVGGNKCETDLKVSAYAEVVIPAGIITNGFINDEKALTDLLRDFAKKFNVSYVHASLPEEKLYLFTTEVSSVSHDEIMQNIEFKLEENVPIPASNALFAYSIISHPSSTSTKVSVSVAPRKAVETYLNVLLGAGIKPLSFSIQAEGLSKAVIPKNTKGAHCLVNVMEENTGIYLTSGNTVCFTSTVGVGSKSFSSVLSGQVQQPLVNKGVDSKPVISSREIIKGVLRNNTLSKEMIDAIKLPVNTLSAEISKVINYWNTHRDELGQVESIMISGDEAYIPGVSDGISKATGVKVVPANVWSNVCSFDNYIPPIEAYDAFDFGVAIGLALKG